MAMAVAELPEDLVKDILLRLPVKSLLRFKSVCKSWYCLIQSPSFISLHRDRAAKNADCLLVERSPKYGAGVLSFVPNDTPVGDIDMSFTGIDIKALRLLGPCNGVVCLTRFRTNSPIVLYNPSMKEFRELPRPYKNEHFSNLGFGFDPSTNDFKVIRFADYSSWSVDKRVEIYNMSTDSWRVVDVVSPVNSCLKCRGRLTSWNGDFYWYVSCHRGNGGAVMAFSMTDEVFKKMPVPEFCWLPRNWEKELFVLKDSLALVIQTMSPVRSFDIWVMNEDDVEVSWTKKFSIAPFRKINRLLGFRQNGELLGESRQKVISYNLNTQERKEYHVNHLLPHVLMYTESLVSVKRHN